MNPSPVPSLKDIANVNVVQLLYDDAEMSKSYELFFITHSEFSYKEELIQKIYRKVSSLDLPVELNEGLVANLEQICLQLRQIKLNLNKLHDLILEMFGDECCCSGEFRLDISFQLPDGCVDEDKLYQHFIEDERLDVRCRFALACQLRRRVDIMHTWEQMTVTTRNRFTENDSPVILKRYAEMANEYLKIKRCHPINYNNCSTLRDMACNWLEESTCANIRKISRNIGLKFHFLNPN